MKSKTIRLTFENLLEILVSITGLFGIMVSLCFGYEVTIDVHPSKEKKDENN